MSAQLKPKPGIKAPGNVIKGPSSGSVSKEQARCNVVWNNYKTLLKNILHKDENETLNINTVMNNVRVKYNPNLTPDLYFRKVSNTQPFPVLGNHIVQQPNGLYPVAVEMVSYLHQANGNNSILSFIYEAGNYNDVMQVMDVFKTGTQTYIKIKRTSGLVQNIRFYPGHIVDGCQIKNQ